MPTASDYQKQQSQAIDEYYKSQAKISQMKRSGASESQIKAEQQKANAYKKTADDLSAKIDATSKIPVIDDFGNLFANTVNAAVGAVTGTVNTAANLAAGALNTAANLAGQAAQAASQAVNTATKAAAEVAGTVGKVFDAATELGEKAAKSVKDLLDKDNKSADKLFDPSKNKKEAKLGGTSNDKGPKEAKSKMKKLNPDDNQAAMAKPNVFLAKTVDDSIKAGVSAASNMSKESVTPGSKLDKSLGGKVADMGKAVGDVTSDLSKNLKAGAEAVGNFTAAATSTINNTIATVTGAVSGVVSGVVGTIKSAVKGVMNTANGVMSTVMSTVKSGISATMSFVSPVMNAGQNLINTGRQLSAQIASAFPGSIGKYLNQASDSYFNNLTDKLTNSKLGNITKILGKLEGIADKGDIFSTFSALKGLYSSNTDANGNPIASNGTASASASDQLYKLAQGLCSGITNNSGTDFAFNKDFYDILMALAADLGMGDLINQLANCGSAKKLFDNRTLDLLKSKIPSVAKSGNPTAFNDVVTTVGPHNVPNLGKQIKVLFGNTPGKTAKEQAPAIGDLLRKAKTTIPKLCQATDTPVPALSGEGVCMMTSTSPNLVNDAIGKNNCAMAQAAYYAYGR